MENVMFVAVAWVTAIGAVCAALICVASKVMAVKADERVAKLAGVLPGSNCGACGFPGCMGYAEALVQNPGTPTNLCPPGGADAMRQLSKILGVESGAMVRKLAVVRCLGERSSTQKKMDYQGIQSCVAARQMFNGENACGLGCLGYGDCADICPSAAVCMEDGLARIKADLCTGCGLCVKVCPGKIISIENENMPVVVMCNNKEKGAVVRKKCSFGCIACRKCVKECADGAISIVENLAVIDYDKCTGCQKCVEVCMTKCIKPTIFVR